MKSFEVAVAEMAGQSAKAIEDIMSHPDLPPPVRAALSRVVARLLPLCQSGYLELMRGAYDVDRKGDSRP